MKFFKRGFVAKAELPRLNIPEELRPSFIMEGSHYVIVLHDSDNPDMDSRSALVMPITSAQAEVNRAHRQGRDMLLSYVPIKQEQHPFLDHNSYVSTGQVVSVNRNWIGDYVGEINIETMEEIDLQAIQNLGLMSMALRLGEQLYQEKLSLAEQEIEKNTNQSEAQ